MKKLLLLSALLSFGISKIATAQDVLPYDTGTKKIIYSEVVMVPNANKDKLFDRAAKALHEMYQQADSKFAVKDKAAGKIVFNGFVRIIYKEKDGTNFPDPSLVKYRLTLLFKDGKYKYEITDFIVDHAGVPFHVERWQQHNVPGDKTYDKTDRVPEKLQFIHDDIAKVLARLKKSMEADVVEEKKDW